MADNVAVTAGTGTIVAADELIDATLGTVKVQYVKIMDGTLDGTSKATVSTNNGLHVGGTIASGIADAGNPIKVGGKYNATAPTLVDGNRGDLQVDVNGNLKVNLTVKLDPINDGILDYPFGHSYTRIVPNVLTTTTVVKSGAGVLSSLTLGVKSTGAATATIYDNTAGSGAIIAVLDTTAFPGGSITLNAAFTTGLTVVMSASTTAADLTTVWR